MFVVAFPLSAAGFAQTSGRSWPPAIHVVASAITLAVALWVVRATLSRVGAPWTAPARGVLRALCTLALMTVAVLNLSVLQRMPAAVWVASVGVGVAAISAVRVGRRVLSPGPLWLPERIGYEAAGAARAPAGPVHVEPLASRSDTEPRRVRPPSAATTRSPAATAFEAIRADMDEVTYAAGRPNVLTMTKFVPGDARDATAARQGDEARVAVPAERSRPETRGTFQRTDREGETVLSLAGVLDVVTVCDLQPLVDALVAEGRRSVVVDAAALRMIDSTGVGAIVGLVKRARSFGGAVRVSGLNAQPLEVFRLLRLDLILELPGREPHSAS